MILVNDTNTEELIRWLNSKEHVLILQKSLVPSTHIRKLTTTANSSFRVSDTLFWPPIAPQYV